MKVLYFYQYFGTAKGSWSNGVYEFAKRWVQKGDSVTVVTSVYDRSDLQPDRFLSRLDVDGIDVRIINVRLSNKHGYLTRVLTFICYAVVAMLYALKAPADVVVASSGPLSVALPGLVARYVRKKPFVFVVRDLWPEGAIQLGILRNRMAIFLARQLENRAYAAASCIVAYSEGMAKWIETNYGFSNIVVIPNAADNQLFAQLPHEVADASGNGRKLVVYTGTLGLIDDCGQILRLAKLLQQWGASDVDIGIIGDGKERSSLEQQAREMELTNVTFYGRISKEQVLQWLRKAHCSLFVCKDVPFLDTASPNKMFDAFAAGVPVVQTTHGWIKDLFEREDCGLTVPPGKPDALAKAVLKVVRDRELHQRLSQNALRVAHEQFDRDLLADRMHQVLRRAAGQPAVFQEEVVSGVGRPSRTGVGAVVVSRVDLTPVPAGRDVVLGGSPARLASRMEESQEITQSISSVLRMD